MIALDVPLLSRPHCTYFDVAGRSRHAGKSEPFHQFRKDLESTGVEWVTKEVTKYYETGPGFMAR